MVKERILVLDDEVGILNLCERVLLEEGYVVKTAAGAVTALQILDEENFDLILSDLKMPDISGIELLKKVKQSSPQTEVIIVTGQATIETAVESLRSGAYDYLLKPFNINELVASVRKCMDYSRLLRQENIFREITNLYLLSQEIMKAKSENKLLDLILERSAKTLGADDASIYMFVPQKGNMVLSARYGGSEDLVKEVSIGEKVAGWVAEKQKPILIQNGFKNMPQFKHLQVRHEIVSSMVCPLINNDIFIGVICMDRIKDSTNYIFTPHDLESLQLFVSHATMLIVALRHQLALLELDELKMEFMANVSHELRTPLMAIGGALELLDGYIHKASVDDKVDMFLSLIGRNTERMRFLVSDLLDFSRMETGALRLNIEKFKFNELVSETIEDFSLKAKEKDINLSAEYTAGEVNLNGDRERIKQVIVNLISNATKFTPKGGEIKLNYLLTGDDSVLVTVSDTGIGIDKTKQGKIFEKFFQVDGSVSRCQNGFGLGLAITKSIVEVHRGKISLESDIGKGTKFSIVLPLSGPDTKINKEEK